ncbi:MAG: DUF2723 domain-containing protein [Anaerolineae bacterium]|nr:DUF2723 domain-containing protein [Anaerolineae bacterium]
MSRSTLHASRLTPHASHTTHHASHLLFLAVFLTVFTLYLLTLAPGVVGGDAGEHQFAAPLLGIPHTTGYPLYILLGKLWTLLIPFGSPAWRMNLFSALNGALAAAVTALIVYHLTVHASRLTPHPSSFILHPSAFLSAILAGLTLAWGLTLWQWSVIAGVRSMNVLFFALITLAAILWGKRMEEWKNGRIGFISNQPSSLPTSQPSNLPTPDPRPPTPYLLALLTGLSLAHHRTTLFYLPSIALWILWHDPHLLRRPRRLLSLVLLGLAPLLLYLFIYFRGINQSPYSHEIISDWPSFWFLVGSGDSQGLFLSIDPAFLPVRLAFIWQDLLTQLSWPGVILAALGGLWLLWRQPRQFLFQSLLVVLLLLFTLDFEVVNLNEAPTWYLMPAYMLFAVWVGLGTHWILDLRHRALWVFTIYDLRLKTRGERTTVHNSQFTIHNSQFNLPSFLFVTQLLITLLLFFLLAYTLAWPNWQRIYADSVAPLDEWRQLVRGTQAQRLVESSLPLVEPNSIIWGDWEQYTPFKYYQLINGWRSDVTVRNPLDRWPEKVAMAHAAGQPVYFTRKPTDLIGTPYLTMVGPLIYLQTAPQFQTPANLTLVNANFEDELELIGYHTQIWPTPSLPPPFRERVGPILQLMLYWRAPHKLTWDYALSLRLLDSMGQEIYKKDAAHPVLSSYPTTLWTPGEVVGDFYELPLPPNSTAITLHLLPYRTEGPGQWHNLTQAGQEGLKLNLTP